MSCFIKEVFRLTLCRSFLFIVSFLVLSGALTSALADDKEEIKATFLALQQAFTAKDGAKALSLFSVETKEYYRMLMQIASGKIKVEDLKDSQLTPLNLIMVKHAKKTLPPQLLKNIKGSHPDRLLKYAVDNGLGSKELTNGVVLGDILVEGKSATAGLIRDHKTLPVRLGFEKEGKEWKVNLLTMFEQANQKAEQFLQKSGLTVQDLEKMVVK